MNEKIYSPEEIKRSVDEAPAFEVIHELAKKSGKQPDTLLAKGVFLGGEVVEAVLQQNHTKTAVKHAEHTFDGPTL